VTDTINLNGVTSLQEMFYGCSSITTVNNMNSWDVSNISNMSGMFNQATFFNQNIGGWNVSSVTNMSFTFSNAANFNQNIGSWNVSSVTNMFAMLAGTSFFNQDISGWDTSLVTDMLGMFAGASSFNQDLSGWCVTLIPSKPSNFDLNASSWILPQPVWGDCSGPQPTPTPTQTPTQTPTNTITPTVTPTNTPTPTITPSPCERNIVVPTLWNGATNANTNVLQLTQTSETLQIQVNDTITDINLATSIVGAVSSDGTYTYVGTGPGGGVAFECDFPLTFTGPC
jgi:surface protein